jgi:hypothetical protein
MVSFVADLPSWQAGSFGYQSPVALCARAPMRQKPLPSLQPGTGGFASPELLRQPWGYAMVSIEYEEPASPYATMMDQVRAGFGRNMSRLPEVFGVSRQAIYNWLNGDTPAASQHARIRNLAEAAAVFHARDFKPTSASLGRVLSGGKSFLQLMSEGADGRTTAEKLVRVMERSAQARGRLATLLADEQPVALSASDLGLAARDEL